MWVLPGLTKSQVQPFRQDGDLSMFQYMRPIFILDSIFGMCSPKQGRLFLFWSYTLFLVVAMSISCLYNIVDTVEEFYDSFEAFQILVSCLAFVILAAAKRPIIEAALDEIHRIDLALFSIGLVHRYEAKKLNKTILGRLMLVLLVCIFDAYSYTILPWTQDGVANIFSYYYFYFLFDIVQLQYNTLAITVGEHFNLINNKIELFWPQLLQCETEMSVVICSHSDLCGVSDLLHDYFSQQLFVVSAFVFCNNTSHAYCMISTIRSTTSGEPAAGEEEEGPRWSIFALRGVFIVFRIFELFWLIAASTFLEEQGSKSFDIISQLTIFEKQPIKNQFVDLHLSMKQGVDIWACGCFKMDYALLLTMLSAASTYIMILIQYAPEKQPEFNVIKMLLALIFLSIFLVGLIIRLSSWKYWHLPGLGIPIFGDLYYTIRNFTISYKAAVHVMETHHNKYGDTTAFRFGPFVFISTADPYILEELAFHPKMSTKEPIIYKPLQGVYEGAFSSTKADTKWKWYKKLILSSLDKRNLEIYHGVFSRRSQELVKVFSKKSGEFDLLPYVMLMALDITFETNCGIAYNLLNDAQVQVHEQLFQIADEYVGRALTLGILKVDQNYLKKFEHVYNFVRKSASDVIENFKNPKLDLGYVPISNKIAARKELTVESIVYPLCELFFETQYPVGVCLSGAMVYLAVYHQYQEMAWTEQDLIFGDSLAEPSYDDLKYMLYLERVIKETIRITSAPVTARRSDGEVKVGTLVIPANATVLYFWERLKKNPIYWKTPNEFDPDNFLPEEVARRPRNAYFGFGAGPRGCPGSQYAMNCAKAVLSTILRNFKLSSPLKPQDLTYHPALLAHLDVPHMVSLVPRHKKITEISL